MMRSACLRVGPETELGCHLVLHPVQEGDEVLVDG
jgi:hypothetical protein